MLSYEFPPLGGGGAKVVAGLAPALVSLGHRVDLVTMGFRELPEREIVEGVQVHRVSCLRGSEAECHPREMVTYLAAAFPKAIQLTRIRKYDLNHTHFLFPDGVLAYSLSKTLGLPYIVTPHGSDVPGYNPDRFRTYHRLLAPVWRRVAGGAKRIACPSETLASLVRKRDPSLPVTIVPNGFDPDRLRPDRVKTDRILVVTRMLPRKGIQYLLEALAELDLPNQVSIVGDGPYLDHLRSLAAELEVRATFHGWMDNDSPELRNLLETSRIFVLPSESENFPISLLEAMAAGMAIITSSGTGCAEVVGDTGVLVPPRNSGALSTALESLAGEPERCAMLGAAARARLEERFSWEEVARQYSTLYGETETHVVA